MKNIENIESAFICAMSGDALGHPTEFPKSRHNGKPIDFLVTEFIDWDRSAGGRFNAYYDSTKKRRL